MKKLLILLLGIYPIMKMYGQQYPQVSQFMYDHTSTNAGSAGSMDMVCTSVIARQQWVGFTGAPQDFILNVNAPFNLFGASHGVGLSIYRDTYGFNADIQLQLSYAYRVTVGDGKLGIGVSGAFLNRAVDGTKWHIPENGTNFWDLSGDNAIPKGKQNEFAFDMGAGLFYRTEDLYVGVSSTHLLESKFKFPDNNGNEAIDKLTRHYFVTASYNITLANPSFEIIPSVFIASDISVTSLDVNTTLLYNKKFWGGVTYRPGSAIIGMLGIEILNGLKIGYSYDFPTSKIINHSQGTHEIVLNYCFKIGVERSPQKYKSIRFL